MGFLFMKTCTDGSIEYPWRRLRGQLRSIDSASHALDVAALAKWSDEVTFPLDADVNELTMIDAPSTFKESGCRVTHYTIGSCVDPRAFYLENASEGGGVMDGDIFDKIRDAYRKWQEHNFPALAIKVSRSCYKEMTECAGGNVTMLDGLTVEIDDTLLPSQIAFKEATLDRWEVMDLEEF